MNTKKDYFKETSKKNKLTMQTDKLKQEIN